MRYKKDWEMSEKRLEAFWHQEIIDRCCASIHVYENGAKAPVRIVPGDDQERLLYWTDPERIIRRNRDLMEKLILAGKLFRAFFLI